jgi:capsular polysaccharide biosynthesis protein
MERFLSSLRKKMWIIATVVLVSSVFTCFYTAYVIQPVYQSNVKLYILHNQVDGNQTLNYSDIMASRELINDYKEIINSDSVINEVLKNLNISNITTEQFAKKIKISSVNNTSVMEISVSDSSPVDAKHFADELSQVFVDKVKDLTNDDTISIVDYASLPDKPISPNIKLNTFLAGFLSLIVSISTIMALELLDDTIKTVDDVEKKYGLKVIGTVPNFNIK